MHSYAIFDQQQGERWLGNVRGCVAAHLCIRRGVGRPCIRVGRRLAVSGRVKICFPQFSEYVAARPGSNCQIFHSRLMTKMEGLFDYCVVE